MRAARHRGARPDLGALLRFPRPLLNSEHAVGCTEVDRVSGSGSYLPLIDRAVPYPSRHDSISLRVLARQSLPGGNEAMRQVDSPGVT
jgi:hypothetical protein